MCTPFSTVCMKMCCPSLAASGSSVSRLISPIFSPDTVDSVTGSSAKTQQCHQEVHLWNKFTLKRARNMQDKTVHALLCKPGIAVYKVVFSPTSEIPIKTLKALWQNHCIDTFTSKQNQLTGSPQINPLINSHTCLQGYPLILLRAWATVKHPARSGRSNKPRSWSYSHTDNPFCK